MGSIDWRAVWEFIWPILKEGFIAFLMALLALLGYDQVVPSRYERPRRGDLVPSGPRRGETRRHPLEQAPKARRRTSSPCRGDKTREADRGKEKA